MSHGQSDKDPRLTLAKRNQLFLSCYWSLSRSCLVLSVRNGTCLCCSLSPLFVPFFWGIFLDAVFLVVQPLLHRLLLSSHASLVSGRILAVSYDYRSAELLLTLRWTQDSEASSFCPCEGAKLMDAQRAEEVIVPTPSHTGSILMSCSERCSSSLREDSFLEKWIDKFCSKKYKNIITTTYIFLGWFNSH